MDAKKRNGVHAKLPPSKRFEANGQGMPPPPVAPEGMEEEDEDVFLEETLLRDEELQESRAAVAALFTKWRRPALFSSDTQKSCIGAHLLLVRLPHLSRNCCIQATCASAASGTRQYDEPTSIRGSSHWVK